MSKSTAVEPSSKFDQVLRGSALLPGVKIDRESFLRKELQHSCTSEQIDRAVATTPADAGVPLEVVNKLAASAIRYETAKVTALSTVAVGHPVAAIPTHCPQDDVLRAVPLVSRSHRTELGH